MNRLNSLSDVTLLMANRVYLMEGCKLLPNFSEALTKNFQSDVHLLNFCNQKAAASTINTWIEEKTKEKIKNLVNKNDLNVDTRLVLVNAIYFKARWREVFNKEATKTDPFYLNDADSVNVQMMHIKKKFYYKGMKELEAQIKSWKCHTPMET
ncbi:hypothetical protein Zmor_014009 [Zophobas morio]|uniref:Serpin domain-containing protein n=1 Tax=Zophobas morio TaxID=2755281 RepID=A0AA38IIU2_9CUCU|nr:hypothetical protein Zmor_014009 [Zophobas morio]